ncbi:hypothetical protein [Nocardia farcinica]|uniref:hypothetical protein n=1 Tax=Nocardia farcinica TaxID=37329 RepID=UPI003429DD33
MTYESPFKPHGHDGPHHDMRFPLPDPATAATHAGGLTLTPAMRETATRLTGSTTAIEDWTAEHLPPAELMAAHVEAIARDYTSWDSPHEVLALVCEEDAVGPAIMVGLDLHLHPTTYPAVLHDVLSTVITDRLIDRPDAAPIVGYSIQVEAHVALEDPRRPDEIQTVREHGVAALPQSQELCIVVASDLAGRVWWATKNRATGEVHAGDPLTPNPMVASFARLMRSFAEILPLVYMTGSRFNQARSRQDEDGRG